MVALKFALRVIILGIGFFIIGSYSVSSDELSENTEMSNSTERNNTGTGNAGNSTNGTSTSMQNTTGTNSSSESQSDSCSFVLSPCCEEYFNDTCEYEEEDDLDPLGEVLLDGDDTQNEGYYNDIIPRGGQEFIYVLIVIIGINSRSCCFNGSNFVREYSNGSVIYVENKTYSGNNRVPEMSISPCYDLFYEGGKRIYKRNPNKTSECCPCYVTCNGNNTCNNNFCGYNTCNNTCGNSTCTNCTNTNSTNCMTTG